MNLTRHCICLFSCLLIPALGLRAQGPLAPPGAPEPTMKSLDEIYASIASVQTAVTGAAPAIARAETRVDVLTLPGTALAHHQITQPGSYYLGGNLAMSKTVGIAIAADDVTLDLNGFRISGVSGTGVELAGGIRQTTIRNGAIDGLYYGVSYASEIPPEKTWCDQLQVAGSFTTAIKVGNSARITRCSATSPYGSGGVTAGDGLCAETCVITKCGGNYALLANNGALVKNCVVYSNQVNTTCISLNEGAVVQGCSLVGNGPGLYGIKTGSGSRILDCVVARNKLRAGIYAGGGSQVSGCASLSNVGSEASSYGIYAGSGSTVEACVATWQTSTLSSGDSTRGMGVYVDSGACVRDCLVRYNMGDGIRVVADSRVERCYSAQNGNGADGAGIHALQVRNVLADNQLLGNDRGMDVDMAGNLIYRNACTFNSVNWSIAAGNGVGSIVVAADSAAVSGDGGGSGTGLGTTDPWANFTY